MELKIDKSNWVRTRLGDVCTWYQREIPNEVQEECGIEFYVTANHIDGGEVRFNRYGSLSDGQKGPTITKHFEEGDLLLSTRSVALRKAAIAPVSGVTGEKLLVLRTSIDSDLIPDLMPFVFQSDDFWNYAQNSASGSVNKFTSWTKLSAHEFLLPPRDQQAEFAELLWALDHATEAQRDLVESVQRALDSQIQFGLFGFSFEGMTLAQIIESLKVKSQLGEWPEFGTFFKGKGVPKAHVVSAGFPCIRYGELYTKHHRIVRRINTYIAAEHIDSAFALSPGDVLIAGSGETIEEIGKSAVYLGTEQAYCGSDVLVFRPFSPGAYWGYVLNSRLVREQLKQRGTGAQVAHIYISDLEKIKVPIHDEVYQGMIASNFESMSHVIMSTKNLIKDLKSISKVLVNELFNPRHL
jgi:type I restriction enzyme S subunit